MSGPKPPVGLVLVGLTLVAVLAGIVALALRKPAEPPASASPAEPSRTPDATEPAATSSPAPPTATSAGAPQVMPHQSPDKDEDPFALLAPDGTAYVFWFSNRPRDGELFSDIVYTTFKDGRFGELHGATESPEKDFYPSAVLDELGILHLAWFRMQKTPPPGQPEAMSWIMYRTIDTKSGELGPEEEVTAPTDARPTFDWVPSIELVDGAPAIAFASRHRTPGMNWDVWWVRRTGDGWSDPDAIPGVSSADSHDTLPALARVDGVLTLAWVRHPLGGPIFAWERADTSIWLVRHDGGTWAAPVEVVPNPTEDIANVFPAFFDDADGRWFLSWQRHVGSSDELRILPLDDLGATAERAPVDMGGYFPRVSRLAESGRYIALWVRPGATETDLDIAFQLFDR